MNTFLSRRGRFLLAVAIQLAIIASIVVAKMSVLVGAKEIVLRIEPIDPRDPMRGDYVTFQYSISRLEPGLFEGRQARTGETVYVVLEPSGETWDAVRVLTEKPRAGELFLKGTMRGIWRSQTEETNHIIYGIEQYFIPEGTGAFRGWTRDDLVTARVAVDKQGNALIRGILINGNPWP